MTESVLITGTGLYHPPEILTNQELVASFNSFVDQFNEENRAAILDGSCQALEYSSAEFIEKASNIKQRYVVNKSGILDIQRMRPYVEKREPEALSIQAEMAILAITAALKQANREAIECDAVIVACTSVQRYYPALAIEIQNHLKIKGFAFDMGVACSSATFGLSMATSLIQSGLKRVIVVSPEICTPHLNFKDRESHFIFGDASAAVILEAKSAANTQNAWEILSTHLSTEYSNNIRSDQGFLSICEATDPDRAKMIYFQQNGRKVFKEVVPKACEHILEHCERHALNNHHIQRYWLHQANGHMNSLIAKKLLNREATPQDAPMILDTFANTASAGSIIAFHLHRDDLKSGNIGVICSFGAGYSVGSVIVRKM
jgi:beta-ketodecanoyl-[acyl-carrier-protein] synthase